MSRRPTRSRLQIAALGAALALTAAGCGGDDEGDTEEATATTATEATTTDETSTTATTATTATAVTETEAGTTSTAAAVPTAPATIEADDQSSDGSTVTVASVTLPAAGFIAVHAEADGAPGPVIGHSDLLPQGTSTEVEITLDEPLSGTATVFPMAHVDANDNGQYDFEPPDVTTDVPASTEAGEVAVVPAEVTVG